MIKLIYIILLVSGILFISACEKKLPNEFILEVGNSIEIEDRWTLRLVDISEDSRCPVDAVCIWEGRVVCNFELVMDKDLLLNFDLSIGAKTDIPQDTILSDFYFELLKVTPQSFLDVEIQKSDYEVQIYIEEVE
jgi:hypothetical protein